MSIEIDNIARRERLDQVVDELTFIQYVSDYVYSDVKQTLPQYVASITDRGLFVFRDLQHAQAEALSIKLPFLYFTGKLFHDNERLGYAIDALGAIPEPVVQVKTAAAFVPIDPTNLLLRATVYDIDSYATDIGNVNYDDEDAPNYYDSVRTLHDWTLKKMAINGDAIAAQEYVQRVKPLRIEDEVMVDSAFSKLDATLITLKKLARKDRSTFEEVYKTVHHFTDHFSMEGMYKLERALRKSEKHPGIFISQSEVPQRFRKMVQTSQQFRKELEVGNWSSAARYFNADDYIDPHIEINLLNQVYDRFVLYPIGNPVARLNFSDDAEEMDTMAITVAARSEAELLLVRDITDIDTAVWHALSIPVKDVSTMAFSTLNDYGVPGAKEMIQARNQQNIAVF